MFTSPSHAGCRCFAPSLAEPVFLAQTGRTCVECSPILDATTSFVKIDCNRLRGPHKRLLCRSVYPVSQAVGRACLEEAGVRGIGRSCHPLARYALILENMRVRTGDGEECGDGKGVGSEVEFKLASFRAWLHEEPRLKTHDLLVSLLYCYRNHGRNHPATRKTFAGMAQYPGEALAQ
jgi:hypothetical protein